MAQIDLSREDRHNPSDSSIVARVRRGESEAFEILMRRYNRRLYRVARSILGDSAEAEDVVQETYIRAFTKLDTFTGPLGFGAWLTKIAVNEALMTRRRRAVLSRTFDVLTAGMNDASRPTVVERPSNIPTPEQSAHSGEIRRLLEGAIDELPDGFREVFVLRAVEQLSIAETSAALNLNPETVKTRFHRANRLLRAALASSIGASLRSTFEFGGRSCDRIVAAVSERLGLRGRYAS